MSTCDICGQFISLVDLESGAASCKLITPDSDYSTEEYEVLCKEHTTIKGDGMSTEVLKQALDSGKRADAAMAQQQKETP